MTIKSSQIHLLELEYMDLIVEHIKRIYFIAVLKIYRDALDSVAPDIKRREKIK